MKIDVRRDEPFQPITVTIVLETEKDAKGFRHLCGCFGHEHICDCRDLARAIGVEIANSLDVMGIPIVERSEPY